MYFDLRIKKIKKINTVWPSKSVLEFQCWPNLIPLLTKFFSTGIPQHFTKQFKPFYHTQVHSFLKQRSSQFSNCLQLIFKQTSADILYKLKIVQNTIVKRRHFSSLLFMKKTIWNSFSWQKKSGFLDSGLGVWSDEQNSYWAHDMF